MIELETVAEKYSAGVLLTPTMFLYHGTRDTDPMMIYNSEEGFDMRFSRPGMWGQAVYFAKNSRYSNNYAHLLPNNHKQMFYAKVNVGLYIDMPDN